MSTDHELRDLCRTSERAWSRSDVLAIPQQKSRCSTATGMTSEQLTELSLQLGVPVEVAGDPRSLERVELVIDFGPGRSIDPIRVRVSPGVGFEDLSGYSAIVGHAVDYNRALAELRILRSLLGTLRPRESPIEPASDLWCAYHELVRLERTIQRRQTERMGSGRITLQAFFEEAQFWRDYHADIAAVIAREVDEDRARGARQPQSSYRERPHPPRDTDHQPNTEFSGARRLE